MLSLQNFWLKGLVLIASELAIKVMKDNETLAHMQTMLREFPDISRELWEPVERHFRSEHDQLGELG